MFTSLKVAKVQIFINCSRNLSLQCFWHFDFFMENLDFLAEKKGTFFVFTIFCRAMDDLCITWPISFLNRGDEEVGEGDIFQIIDPDESTAFDEGTDLGLGGNQVNNSAIWYKHWLLLIVLCKRESDLMMDLCWLGLCMTHWSLCLVIGIKCL